MVRFNLLPEITVGFVLIRLLFLQSSWLSAQPADQVAITMEEISTQQGLSQGMVSCFLNDRNGFLWIGTKDGLNRYDGYEFQVFRKSDTDSITLIDNYITAIFEDKEGMLWIGTMLNGITRYNPFLGEFISLTCARTINEQLSGQSIRSIRQDSKGNIWVGSSGGIDILTPQEKSSEKQSDYSVISLSSLASDIPKHAFDVQYWRFPNDESVELYSRKKVITINYPLDQALVNQTSTPVSNYCSFPEDELIQPIFDEKHKRTFFFSASGISVFDQKLERITASYQVSIDLQNFPSPLLDRNGRIWVKVEQGLSIYYPETNTLSRVTSGNPLIDNARFNDFYSAHEDHNGILWFGTFGYGILKYVCDQEKFGVVSRYNDHPMSLSGIYETPDGDVVVQAYQTNDPIRCDLNKRLFTKPFSGFSTIDSNIRNVNSLAFDFKDVYVTHKHIYKLSLKNGSYLQLKRPEERPEIIFDPLFVDSRDSLWCADGHPAGIKELHKIDKQSGEITQTHQFPESKLHHEYRFVSDWKEDSKGNFWFGTLKGVYRFNTDSATWKIFPISTNENQNLTSEVVFSLCFDPNSPDSVLWVGTNGFGLKRLNIISGEFKTFNVSTGLPNNVIYGILSDHRKNLWLSTNRGLCLFNSQNNNTRNFTKADGLQSDEFNRYAHLKMSNGMLLFGGVNGLTFFDPEQFYKFENSTNTVITGFKVNNEPVEIGQLVNNQVLLYKPIEYTQKITFSHDISMISISFAYMNMAHPANNSFRYRLKGFNEDWIQTAGQHEATYTNLSPGIYTFEVVGKSNHGNWNSQSAIIELTILPPWWATWWFRTIAIIVFASFLYGLYRYRMAHLIGMERMRNRIAQDLHDEIGSTLSSISLYSAVMQKSTNNLPTKASDILGKIINSTSEIMEKMNDMVWTIKSDNDDFEQVVNRMRAFAVNMTDSKGIKLHFMVGQKTESLKLDMDKRKNIYLIFKEAVNNAVKYSGCKNLNVSLTKNGNQLILLIKDDGAGFDINSSSENNDLLGGNGITGMKIRAKELKADFEISSLISEGTTIEVAIPINH